MLSVMVTNANAIPEKKQAAVSMSVSMHRFVFFQAPPNAVDFH